MNGRQHLLDASTRGNLGDHCTCDHQPAISSLGITEDKENLQYLSARVRKIA
jgi:hypothetical protein